MPINDLLDINGWNLDKALKLLHKSNPTVFEWFSSPIIYSDSPFADRFRPVMQKYFSSKSGLWHYLSMDESNYRQYLKGEIVRAKKYFYVLRPILACKWTLGKGPPPPMLFSELMDSQLEEPLKPVIESLLQIKMNDPKVKLIPRVDSINEYLDLTITKIREQIERLPNENVPDW